MLIFIISQGRTGSTMLWNLFRNIPECTAYVEPFHLMVLNGVRTNAGPPPEARHPFIKTYWTEYKKTISWKELFDKWAWLSSPKYEIKEYLDLIINSCNTEYCVLQFNRVWGELLCWLRKTYPEAYIIHLWRDKLKQHKSYKKLGFFGEHFGELQFGCPELWYHYYDLRVKYDHSWGKRGISNSELFSVVWTLAKNDGELYSDVSIKYENIINNPEGELTKLLRPLNLEQYVPNLLQYIRRPSR